MFPNAKGSELLSVLATIDPSSQAAGTTSTGWVFAGNHHTLLALIEVGGLGVSGTVDAKIQQAVDSSGTSVKDVSGKSITQFTQVGGASNKQALINLRSDDLDVTNGFAYVRLSITTGVAASLTSAQLLGLNPRFASADASNQSAVAQII
jgi:hypothetical protein